MGGFNCIFSACAGTVPLGAVELRSCQTKTQIQTCITTVRKCRQVDEKRLQKRACGEGLGETSEKSVFYGKATEFRLRVSREGDTCRIISFSVLSPHSLDNPVISSNKPSFFAYPPLCIYRIDDKRCRSRLQRHRAPGSHPPVASAPRSLRQAPRSSIFFFFFFFFFFF